MAYQRIPLDAREGAREARTQNQIENSGTPQGMMEVPQLDPMAMGGVTPMAMEDTATADINPTTDIVDPMEQMQMQQQAQELAMYEQSSAQAMLNPVELLRLRAEQAEDEVSLDTLSASEKEKILKSYIQCRGIAKKYYEEIIEPEILERREIYWGDAEHYDKVFPQLSEFCRWVSKDVKTTCEWILPGLMETFTGSDSPISVKGVSVEDDNTASKIQELVQYQLTKKNDFHGFVRSNIDTALKENWSVAKVWWNREEEHIKMRMMLDLNESDALIALIQGEMNGKISIKKMKELDGAPDLMEVEYEEIKPKFNYPAIEFVPSSEIRFTPDATILRDCKFVAHRKVVKGDYLKRRERDGIYKNVDKALHEYGDGDTEPSVLDLYNDRERMDKLRKTNDNDIASKEVELYEAYLDVDYNNDGIFEKLIIHAVGDNLISVQKNESDIAPFFECCSIYDANRVFPLESFSGQFEQQQDLKTAMVRSIIINTTKNNMPRQYVDEHKVDMDALLAGEEIIPTMGNPSEAVFVPSSLPLAGITMDLINYAQNELEAQSGSTRYNQGLDSNSLNKTATGVTAVMGASEKRNKLMARSIAENFFIPIYKYIIELNQMYLEDEQIIRLTNESIKIRKEDLDIDYDLVVNVGEGTGTKEAQIQYIMYLMTNVYPVLQQLNIVNEQSWYGLSKRLLEQIGLRDTTSFLVDPNSPQAQQAKQQAQQMAQQAQDADLERAIRLNASKTAIPRISVDLKDLPPDAQQAWLEQTLGLTTTERAIVEHEAFINE